MKKAAFLSLMLFLSIATFAQKLPAEKIIGVWKSDPDEDVQLRFEFFKSGDQYAARLLWASTMFEADGKTAKKDFNNPDAKLRGRSRQNIVNVTHLTYKDGEYTGGSLYNPDNGSTYSLNIKLKNASEMEFRGYMGVSIFGKTMKFVRVH